MLLTVYLCFLDNVKQCIHGNYVLYYKGKINFMYMYFGITIPGKSFEIKHINS